MTSDPAAPGPSSSSLLGPLNLHMYRYSSRLSRGVTLTVSKVHAKPCLWPPSRNLSSDAAAENSFITSCIEEDEQETSSQPSMSMSQSVGSVQSFKSCPA